MAEKLRDSGLSNVLGTYLVVYLEVIQRRRLQESGTVENKAKASAESARLKRDIIAACRKVKVRPGFPDRVNAEAQRLFTWLGRVRPEVMSALADLCDLRALPFLAYGYLYGNDLARYHAVRGMGRFSEKQVVQLLIAVLHDSNDSVRRLAEDVLVRFGTVVIEPLLQEMQANDDLELNRAGYGILERVPVVASVDFLVGSLTHQNPYYRNTAANGLVGIGAASVGPILKLLTHDADWVRVSVIDVLGRIPCAESLRQLRELLASDDATTLCAVLNGLGNLAFKGVGELIINQLKNPDPVVRLAAVGALGRRKEPDAVPVLLERLHDKELDVRVAVVRLLREFRDLSAVEPLLGMFSDSVPDIRRETAVTLAALGYVNAVEPLAAQLKTEPTDSARLWEAVALADLGDVRAIPFLALATKTKGDAAGFALDRLELKLIPPEQFDICGHCFKRLIKLYEKKRDSLGLRSTLAYHACPRCGSNLYVSTGVGTLTLVLDRRQEELCRKQGTRWMVNALLVDHVVDFDRIEIIDADEFQVEKMMVMLKNDPEDRLAKGKYNVYLNSSLNLSQAKLNLLRDYLELVETDFTLPPCT